MTSPADIVNESLQLIASQVQISALNDGSDEANAALAVYAPTVQLLLRQLDSDFARLPSFVLPPRLRSRHGTMNTIIRMIA